MKNAIAIAGCLLLAGCAGKLDYVSPAISPSVDNSVVLNEPKSDVWARAVPALGKEFYVINNLDKESGLINISYRGDPERYIDCGRVTSYVSNARGERTYDFPAARAEQHYEIMLPQQGLFVIDRRMDLEGRMNLIFEELNPKEIRVTANTRYVVVLEQSIQQAGQQRSQRYSHTISFNTGQRGSFPAASGERATECVPNGRFERDVLRLIQ